MESIWTSSVKIERRKPLSGDITAKAAVIGGGLAGILIAWYLKRRGIETVVLEENRIGGGQTGFTTAKITCQHNLIYDKLIRQFGTEKARLYAKANLAAIGEYERLIRMHRIDCDFSWQPSYLFSTENVEALEKEARAARLLGIDAEVVTDAGLPFQIAGALRFDRQAQFHPLKFLEAMASELTIYEQTRVISAEQGRNPGGSAERAAGKVSADDSLLITNRGLVTAKYVIFACHYPFINFPGFYFTRLHQERSYVLALEKVSLPEGIFLGVDRENYSLRTAGDRVLLGGCSHRTGGNRGGGEYDVLREKAREWFPKSQEVGHWSAQDCMSLDEIPYIGRFSMMRPNWYVAAGFNKWGMTSSMAAAQIIPDLICGIDNAYESVFCPQRFNLRASAKNLLCNLKTSAVSLTKSAFEVPDKETHEVKHCPHLGCRLEWNADDQLWECPCHGSCFEESGKKTEGPAQKNLKRDAKA